MASPQDVWQQAYDLVPISFVCGHCGESTGAHRGYRTHNGASGSIALMAYICGHCQKLTLIDQVSGRRSPGPRFGRTIAGLPDDIEGLYEQARDCFTVSAFTAVAMLCRKLLMNTAVAKGANEGEHFVSYVQYLKDKAYIAPDAEPWVKHIKDKGNEANHEIRAVDEADAKRLMALTQQLLISVYELPAILNPPAEAVATPAPPAAE